MNLIEKIDTRSAKVGVIGLGYVGLPLAMEFVNAGYKVSGIDIDQNKINSLNDGKNYINDVNDKKLNTFPCCIIVSQEKWHLGVLGIVASRLKEKYYR